MKNKSKRVYLYSSEQKFIYALTFSKKIKNIICPLLSNWY